jgi:hypothetical protein
MPYDPSQGLSPEEIMLMLAKARAQQPMDPSLDPSMGMESDPGRSFALEQPPEPESYDTSNFPSGGVLPDYGFGDPSQMSKEGLAPGAFGEISAPPERPQQYTQMLDEMTPPPIPGGGMIARALPKAAGAFGAGLGLNAMMGSTSDADEGPASELAKQQGKLRARLEDTRAKMDAAENGSRDGKVGRGKDWRALKAEADQIESEISGISAQIEAHRNSPEYQQDMDRRAKEIAADLKKKEAATPWRDRNPGMAGALPAIGMFLAGAVPGLTAIKRQAGTMTPGALASRLEEAIKAAERGIGTGGAITPETRIASGTIENILEHQPKGGFKEAGKRWGEESMHTLGAGAAGGSLAAEANMFPDQYDAFNLPDGEAKEKAHERAMNPWNYAERGGVGTITGISGYHLGKHLTPAAKPNWEKGRAVADEVGRLVTAEDKVAKALAKAKNAKAKQRKTVNGGPLKEEQKALPPPDKREFIPGERQAPRSGMTQGELNEKLTDFADAWFKLNAGKKIKGPHILNIAKQNGVDMSAGQAQRLAGKLNRQYGPPQGGPPDRFINAGARAALTKKKE